LVEISGIPAADFEECALPVASIEAIELKERAGAQVHISKLPTIANSGNLLLKRGLVNSTALWDWYSGLGSGTGAAATVTVTLLDDDREPVIKWSFTNALPVKYEGPVLDGKTNDLAVETLEVAVEEMRVISSAAQSTQPKGASGRERPPESPTRKDRGSS
jgi:phage tail-like protein